MKQAHTAYTWRQALWVFAANCILLGLTLTGTVFSFLSAYAIPVSKWLLFYVCIGVTIALAGIFLLRRYQLAAIGGLLLLGAFWAWDARETLVLGAKTIWSAAYSRLLEQLVLPELPLEPVQWDPGHVRCATVFLAAAIVLLALLLALVVIRGKSLLGAFLLTFPWILPAFLAEYMPHWPFLLLLAAGWLLMLFYSICGREDAVGASRLTTLYALPVAAFLMVLTWAMPPDEYTQPQWALSARDWVVDQAAQLGAEDSVGGVISSLYPGGTDTSVRLDVDGSPSYSGKTVLKVESDYVGRVYLRGTSAAIYGGDAWEPLSVEVYQEIGLADDALSGSLQGYEPLNFPAMTSPNTPFYEMNITYVRSLNGKMFTPYQLLTTPAEIADVEFVFDSHLERRFGIREKNLYFRPNALPDQQMQPLSWEAAQAEAQYRLFVYEHYLEVPETLRGFLESWLMDAVSSEPDWRNITMPDTILSPYRISLNTAFRVTKLLEETTSYDLQAPSAPEGQDMVQYFLSESHRGYCMHYATAGTLLMRCLGIPARYVSGYTVALSGGETEVPDSAAHAWVEIYLDGYGWYPVEMTPAAIGESTESLVAQPAENTPLPEPEPVTPPEPELPEPTEEPQEVHTPQEDAMEPEASQQEVEQKSHSPGIVITVAAVGLFIGAWCLIAYLRRRWWTKQMTAPDTNRAVIAAYAYLMRLKVWHVEMDPLVAQLAEKARFSQHRLTGEERDKVCSRINACQTQLLASLPPWKRRFIRYIWIP